jgi:hypothetical protein
MTWASFEVSLPASELQICAYPIRVGPLPAVPIGGRTSAPGCSFVCQVQGERDLAHYFCPLPDDYWAMPPLGRGMGSYPTIRRAWWLGIVQEYAAGMSGPKLAEKDGVGSTRTNYLILEKYRREQGQP